MVLSAIILFCLAVALGLFLVVLGVRYRRGSRGLAAVHAGVALLGLSLLGIQVFRGPIHFLYNSAAVLFVLALAGGLMLLALRLGEPDHQSPPSMIGVSLHAAMGLLALLLLVLGYLQA
jgi:phosphatidylserine synthase